MKIGELFQRPIQRAVNPVVKVEDKDEAELRSEIDEYVITEQIAHHFINILDKRYLDREPTGTALWISGFFGSGKSLFLKLLAMIVGHDVVGGLPVIGSLVSATDDGDLRIALQAVAKRKPALVISMQMGSDNFADAKIVDLLWRKLHEVLGYSRTPWVAEMERSLNQSGLRESFEAQILQDMGKPWDVVRNDTLVNRIALAKALATVDGRYPDEKAALAAIDETREVTKTLLTPASLAKRCLELLADHEQYDRVFFALDEMGQFAANRSELLLELQTIVEDFSRDGRGKLWLAATAQERLDAVVDNFPGISDMVQKIRDRFPRDLRIELSKENAEVVVRERLLRKSSEKRQMLEEFLRPYESWLLTEPVFKDLKREYKPPELAAVVDSYPFLPAHFQVITDFMQGLARDMGGTADRTARTPRALIAVTQDIAKNLAQEEIGALVRVDHVYAHMQGNIPSEDGDVVADLKNVSGAPNDTRRVLEATYVLNEIGADRLPATAQNIYRSLLPVVGGGGSKLSAEVASSLVFLADKAFVREMGAGENVTYRFLKAYQRKIEDDVRLYNVQTHVLQERARELITQGIKQLIPSSKGSYKGVRTFTLGFPVDNDIASANLDIIVNAFSPMVRHAPDDAARELSVSTHQAYWVPAELPEFHAEVRGIAAMQAVLANRNAKPNTEEERQQIGRAQEDLNGRISRLLGKTVDALKRGVIYIEGMDVPVSAQPGETIVEEVVERRYPGLAQAPVRVDEKDLEAVFAAPRPTSGALSDLGLLVNGDFKDGSAIAQAVLAAVQLWQYKSGAYGERIIADLQQPPHGYADMQTRLTVSVLCAQGRLKAFAPGGVPLSLGNGLEQRLRLTNEFKKTLFEREVEVDPLALNEVAAVLQQRFDRKGGNDLPLVARDLRAAANGLLARITKVEALVRGDVPQAIKYLSPLKTAVENLQKARTDAAQIMAAVEHRDVFDKWQTTLKPLEELLDAEGVAAIVGARELISSPAVVTAAPSEARQLSEFIEGPHPWKDLKAIRQWRDAILAIARAKLAELHQQLDVCVDSIEERVKTVAADTGVDETTLQRALEEAKGLRCAGFVPTQSGSCATCRGNLADMPDRIDATEARLEKILKQLTSTPHIRIRVPAVGEEPSPLPTSQHARPAAFMLREVLNFPRVLKSHDDVQAFLNELRAELERTISDNGSATIIS